MAVNEELQKEETNEVLSDLSVDDEQASKTSGGAVSVNFAAIKFAYKPQKPDGTLD